MTNHLAGPAIRNPQSAIVLLVLLALIATWFRPDITAQPPAMVNVHLLALNDFHGGIEPRTMAGRPAGGVAALAGHFSARRAQDEHTLAVGAGDLIGGSPPLSNLLREEPSIVAMDLLGVELSAIGNHELDRGLPTLRLLQDGGCDGEGRCFAGARMRYLSANVIEDATGAPVFPPYATRVFDGITVGFIGVTLRDTPANLAPGAAAGLTFLDEVETVNRYTAELKAAGVRAIVVLLHQGGGGTLGGGEITGTELRRIAEGSDPEVDVIVSAHTHRGYQGAAAGRLVTQAFSGGNAFADIDLDLNPATGDVVRKRAAIVIAYADAVALDPAIVEQVTAWQEEIRPIVARPVGVAANAITRRQNRAGESALGNLVSDAMRAAMGTDIACTNAGGLRADLPAGDVTYGLLLTIVPFGNDLVSMTLTGEQIARLLNQQWAGQEAPSLLKCSGMRYTWDGARPPDSRVALGDITLDDGSALEVDSRYTLTVNSFLAGGGDAYTVLTEAADQTTGPTDIDALVAYISRLPQPFTAAIEGRIRRRD
ncbi:MAG: 5'-nucleotidase C-terminal domain-containing protein [Chloroflexi bacterium]|nr:5'-nucleotidase C-terminal domain-containing protein [Chloroflexota bacterium]